MKNPIILLGPTPPGGSVVPVTGDILGDLRNVTLRSVVGPAVVIDKSNDGTTWNPVTLPEQIYSGFIRFTRTDTSSDATLIAASLPDVAPAGLMPVYGLTGQILAKTGNGDFAVNWATRGFVPAGGAVGEVLTKTAAGDFATAWIAAPSGGGGGGTTTVGPILPSAPVSFSDGPGSGAAQNKPVESIRISPSVPSLVSYVELPGVLTPADVLYLTATGDGDFTLLDLATSDPKVTFETRTGPRTRISFPPLYLGVKARFGISLASERTMSFKPNYAYSPDQQKGATFIYWDADYTEQIGFAYVVLSATGSAVANGPVGPYFWPTVTTPSDFSFAQSPPQPGYTELYLPSEYGPRPAIRLYQLGGFVEIPFPTYPTPEFPSGPSYARPGNMKPGDRFFDTDIHKPLWYDGGWRDANGTLV